MKIAMKVPEGLMKYPNEMVMKAESLMKYSDQNSMKG